MLINFDFDGVIADTFEQLLQHCIEAQRILGQGRAPVAEDFRTVENLTFGGLGQRLGMSTEEIDRFETITFDLQKKSKEISKFYKGMDDVIKKISIGNVLAIVSSSSSEIVHKRLLENGVEGAFKKIMGGEMGLSKSESILANMSHFSFRAEDTYMIGDAVSDIRFGKAAKVKTIGVTWGFQSRELLEGEAPDWLIHSPEELLCLFGKSKTP